MVAPITLTVNGAPREVHVEPRALLVYFLRDQLGLTGTHVGCDTSQCGGVHGARRRARRMKLHDARRPGGGRRDHDDRGLGANGLHPFQQAFWEEHGLQCGFCTPGMIITATDLLAQNPDPTEAEVRHALEGNLCRCTGYQNIVDAMCVAATVMRQQPSNATFMRSRRRMPPRRGPNPRSTCSRLRPM